MADFLLPNDKMEGVYTMFALGASYIEDVIKAKHDYENLEEVYPEQQEPMRAAIEFLDQIYQYGEAGNTRIDELGKETFEEAVLSLEEFDSRD